MERRRGNLPGERAIMAKRNADAEKNGKITGRFQNTRRVEKDAKKLVKEGHKKSQEKLKVRKARYG